MAVGWFPAFSIYDIYGRKLTLMPPTTDSMRRIFGWHMKGDYVDNRIVYTQIALKKTWL